MTALLIQVPPSTTLSDDQFYDLCQANSTLRIERTATGTLIVMPPIGGETGRRNARLTSRFVVWSEATGLGEVFDSSTGFKLPNGANRSPDVAWVRQERWNALALAVREKFPPIAPDFVLELMPPTDSRADAQVKMQEYIDNGVQLGWLLDHEQQQVEIYQPSCPVQILNAPGSLAGEPVLPGFRLSLQDFW